MKKKEVSGKEIGEALLPKKVKRDTYQKGLLSEMNIFRCPSCDNQDTIWDITGDGMNYCGECGQRLDWEGWNNV